MVVTDYKYYITFMYAESVFNLSAFTSSTENHFNNVYISSKKAVEDYTLDDFVDLKTQIAKSLTNAKKERLKGTYKECGKEFQDDLVKEYKAEDIVIIQMIECK